MYKEEDKMMTCLECGEGLTYGRSDRKFCSQECKNHFHNKQNSSSRSIKLRVLNALDKNYQILDNLLKNNVLEMDIGELVLMGYKLSFITSYHKIRGHYEYYCFDMKYCMSDNRIYSIKKINIIDKGKTLKTAK